MADDEDADEIVRKANSKVKAREWMRNERIREAVRAIDVQLAALEELMTQGPVERVWKAQRLWVKVTSQRLSEVGVVPDQVKEFERGGSLTRIPAFGQGVSLLERAHEYRTALEVLRKGIEDNPDVLLVPRAPDQAQVLRTAPSTPLLTGMGGPSASVPLAPVAPVTLPTVFVSYSHKDEAWKERLVTHLSVLKQEGRLDVWDDNRVKGGDDFLPEIEHAMGQAHVAILLVSADYLNSSFVLRSEIPRLLERRQKEGLRVIPVIARECAWKRVGWLSKMLVRPKDGKALAGGTEHEIDAALAALVEEVDDLLSK